MSEPFHAYQPVDFRSRTIFAIEGGPVPFDVLAAVGRANERRQVVADRRAIKVLYLKTFVRLIASLVGWSGVCLAWTGFAMWYLLAVDTSVLPMAAVIAGGSVLAIAILILRGVVRRRGGYYFISDHAAHALGNYVSERERLRKRRAAALERLKQVDRLPKDLSSELERLGRLGGIHLDEVERFRGECEKAKLYAEREHHPTREASARIETLRERLAAESAMLEKAIKLTDRLAIAYAMGPGADTAVSVDHAALRTMLSEMEQAFARGGRTFESAVPADADPRYASGKPHD